MKALPLQPDKGMRGALPTLLGLAVASALTAITAWILESVVDLHCAGILFWLSTAGFTAAIGGWLHARLEAEAVMEAVATEKDSDKQIFGERPFSSETGARWLTFERRGTWIIALIIFGLTTIGWAEAGQELFAGHHHEVLQTSYFSYGGLFLIGGLIFALIIFGRTAGIAFCQDRHVRSAAGLLLLQGYGLLGIALSAGISQLGNGSEWVARDADIPVYWGGFILFTLLILDQLTGMLMALYRSGQKTSVPVYEGRFPALLIGTGGWLTAFKETLAYQFGVNVTREQIAQILLRRVVPLILLQFILLMLATSAVVIPSGTLGGCERFGNFTGKLLSPGFHLKMPWPFENVRLVPEGKVETLSLGSQTSMKNQLWKSFRGGGERRVGEGEIQLTAYQGNDGKFSEDFIESNLEITYQVVHPDDCFFRQREGKEILTRVAYQQWIRSLLVTPSNILLSGNTAFFCDRLKNAVQKEADHLSLGIQILSADILAVQPPAINHTADAARERAEADLNATLLTLTAESRAVEIESNGKLQAQKLKTEAGLYAAKRLSESEAAAQRFTSRAEQIRKLPAARMILSLETAVEAYSGLRKLFLAVRDQNIRNGLIMQLDLKELNGPNLLDAAE